MAGRVRDAVSTAKFARMKCDSLKVDLEVLRLSQPFKPSETLEAKKHNLREAARCINRVVVLPGETFSFWRIVGDPNDRHRFKAGRTIHGGVVKHDLGGGLCQASGIIYHASLLTGLKVVERHNHSLDLYNEQTRFAPIGTDATVFYGYKDLRVVNDTGCALRFELRVENESFELYMYASDAVRTSRLETNVDIDAAGAKHVTLIDQAGRVVSRSHYQPAP